jgi:UDP-N-acetylglucosamine--N-acetylmuramyl-(pentapeptide) pyrophosphoryl-undecaprenol N-acetylglucosamine transferase
MRQRVCITVGGTAGHVLPASRLAEGLKEQHDLFFAGVKLGQNPYFKKSNAAACTIEGANFSSGIYSGSKSIIKGVATSLRFLREHKIQKVVGFGSFHSLPILMAAKLLRLELYLYESNVHAGRVNSLFSRFATKSFTLFDDSHGVYGKKECVGLSLMAKNTSLNKQHYHKKYGLNEKMKTLLICGGSLGSDIINEYAKKVASILPAGVQIIHLVGRGRDLKKFKKLYDGRVALVLEYCDHMHELYCMADCAMTRSGANTIAECIQHTLPCIYIPLKSAIGNHQEHNARYMQNEIRGGALITEDHFCQKRVASFVMDVTWLEQKRQMLALAQERLSCKASIISAMGL